MHHRPLKRFHDRPPSQISGVHEVQSSRNKTQRKIGSRVGKKPKFEDTEFFEKYEREMEKYKEKYRRYEEIRRTQEIAGVTFSPNERSKAKHDVKVSAKERDELYQRYAC